MGFLGLGFAEREGFAPIALLSVGFGASFDASFFSEDAEESLTGPEESFDASGAWPFASVGVDMSSDDILVPESAAQDRAQTGCLLFIENTAWQYGKIAGE